MLYIYILCLKKYNYIYIYISIYLHIYIYGCKSTWCARPRNWVHCFHHHSKVSLRSKQQNIVLHSYKERSRFKLDKCKQKCLRLSMPCRWPAQQQRKSSSKRLDWGARGQRERAQYIQSSNLLQVGFKSCLTPQSHHSKSIGNRFTSMIMVHCRSAPKTSRSYTNVFCKFRHQIWANPIPFCISDVNRETNNLQVANDQKSFAKS